MSISSNNVSSLSQSANGSHTTLQANVFNSSSPSLSSAAQNETVYHVRNSSSTASTRSGGKDQQQSAAAPTTTTGGGKRIVFVRLTDAAIQQFEKLALDLYGGSRSSSKKTHSNPTISCFKRKAPNGLERSEGEITIPSSNGAASSSPEAANAKFPFTVTSANNCDPRSSFECVKLRRSVKNSSISGGNNGDGAHLGFFRHQFQVRASEAESFSSTKRKLQDIQLEESKTKGLASLPEKAGLRKPTVSVVTNSHSSSNLASLSSKKVKSHNQPGTLKPVASATKLSIPPSNYAGVSSKKSPGNALSPLVSSVSTTAGALRHEQKQIPTTSTKVHHSTNNSPVIQKTSSPAAAVSKPAVAGQSSGSKTATPQSSSTFPTSDSSKLSHKAPPPVSKTSVSSVSPTAPVQTLPPPQKPTGNSGIADKNGDAAAATTAAVSAGISGGKQLAPAVQRPPPPIEKAVLTTTLAANKKESPTATSASGGGGIALLRNGVAPYRAPAITTTQRSGAAVDAATASNRSRQPLNDDSTSPKENFASSSGAYSTFGSSTAATYGGGSSAEHDKMMLDNMDSRPESAYSSGNESSSSTGASNPHHPFSSGINGSGNQPHATHINSGSNGPGSASSITSNSSSSAATSANHDITSSDAARHDQLLAWSRTIRQCTSFSERQRLTELYTLDWEKYGELRQYIFAVRTKFDDLKADLDMARGRRADHQRISERIRYEYEMEMRHNNYKHKRQHYDRLRAHLTRLSSLIQAYDEKREVQLKNKLMQNGNDVEMVSSGNVTNHMPPLMEHHHHPQQRLVAVGHMRR